MNNKLPHEGLESMMSLLPAFSRVIATTLMALVPLSMAHASDDNVKIGFIVKKPEQAWFINEQRAASELGQEQGFTVVRLAGEDGQQVLSAIDNLNAQGAQGFVICPPDVRLGMAIANRAKQYGMKVVTVDDQFVGSDGKPMTEVPHLGMSGYKIGEQVGNAIAEEMKRRGWDMANTGALRISNNELPTARERTDGATQALLDAGFNKDNVIDAPQQNTDTTSAFTAASPMFSKYGKFDHWVIYALNEESVLGGVRASEQYGLSPDDVIGVGINGSGAAFAEFSREKPTGFYGTVAVSSTMHGRQSAENLYEWIANDKQPPANTETTGTLMTRDNWKEVREELQL